MSLLEHIVVRALLHFIWAIGLVGAVTIALTFMRRKWKDAEPWIPEPVQQRLLIAGMVIAMVAFTREPYDVSNGQPLLKAITDFISWVVGCAVGVWGIYRLRSLK